VQEIMECVEEHIVLKFLWMLPSGRISIMGGESAAFVLSSVSGKKGSWSKEEQDSFKKDILKRKHSNL